MKKWGVDTVGPLPRTQSGNEYSVVAVDYLTKWPEARVLKDKRAASFKLPNKD